MALESNLQAEESLRTDPELALLKQAILTYDGAPSLANARLVIDMANKIENAKGYTMVPLIIHHLRAGIGGMPQPLTQRAMEWFCRALEAEFREFFIRKYFRAISVGKEI